MTGLSKKPWDKKTIPNSRQIKKRSILNSFLIYCEGTVTEPEYFESFPTRTDTEIKAVGLGRSKTALVKKVIELLSKEDLLENQAKHDPDRQLWCVFDMDYDHSKDKKKQLKDFDDAINLALKNKIRVAYSNDAFELWFVLHDKYLTSSWSRKECYEHLTNKFETNYVKGGKTKANAPKIHSHLIEKQPIAIKNAKKLHKEKQNLSPSLQCPCTTVYLLVEELNKSLKI